MSQNKCDEYNYSYSFLADSFFLRARLRIARLPLSITESINRREVRRRWPKNVQIKN
jgi:hypothetical protein